MTGERGTQSGDVKRSEANDNAPQTAQPTYVGKSGVTTDASPQSALPDRPYVRREMSKSLKRLPRVGSDIPLAPSVTIAEVELCEAYLSSLISGIIANDNEP
jgi:hypothetical protein